MHPCATTPWASESEIWQTGLSIERDANKKSGIILGGNPYTRQVMFAHSGENVLLVAPSRSGKSIGVVIPTALF